MLYIDIVVCDTRKVVGINRMREYMGFKIEIRKRLQPISSYNRTSADPPVPIHLTPTHNHNLVKLRLRLNSSNGLVGSAFVKPSAT